MVANLLSRGAELRYRREFGVSLWEWRTIALLGAADEPHSLGDLARAAGIDKSQMSRVVSGLTKRKLVMRAANDEDGRGVRLRLSKSGRKLYGGLIGAAAERDAAFRSCLSASEKTERSTSALNKLAGQARELIRREETSDEDAHYRAARHRASDLPGGDELGFVQRAAGDRGVQRRRHGRARRRPDAAGGFSRGFEGRSSQAPANRTASISR